MGHGYLQNVNINNFGPAGNTPGLCTKSAIKVDIIAESHITGVQTADNRANSCAIADAMDCGSSVSCTGPASGQNTGHYSDNTILSTNSPCGSVGIWEGGTHSSVYGTSIWGFAVPLLLASGNSGGGSWMVVGNTLDEAGCAANGVAAAIQFGHSGSGQVQGPATIIGNDIPGGGSHNLSGIGIAGNSTDTIRGVNFSDNSSALTAIPILWAATVGCTTSLGLYPCFVGMNPGFNALNPNQAGTGWVSSFEGGQFGALSLSAQTANLGATNVTGNITVNPYARINCSITQTNVATTATIPTCTVSYTDVVSNTVQTRTLTSASSANVAGTNSSGMVWVALKAGTNVTVTTAGYASTGTAMQYSILATVVGE
jgi:hypothetical protein